MSCGHVEIDESFRSVMVPDFPEPFALISVTAFISDLATNDPFISFPVCSRTSNYKSYDMKSLHLMFLILNYVKHLSPQSGPVISFHLNSPS